MLLKSTIARPDEEEDPGRSQPLLFEMGLEHVRRLAKRVWTDHNVHDPGITTLELLCYALTDLTYRAEAPIEDLLMDASGSPAAMQAHFVSARTILPMRPLTVLDYRKLMLDIPGVQNAWMRPVETTYYADIATAELRRTDPGRPGIRKVEVRGVYRPIVAYTDDVTSDGQRAEVRRQVMQRLHGNRNLCEDFLEARGVDEQAFLLCGEIELSADADIAQVKAEALVSIDRYLSPPVSRYTLSGMLARTKADGQPYTAPDVFDGPVPLNGFIDDAELEEADLRTEIRLSDVISELMDIDGVEAVRDIVVSPREHAGAVENRWIVEIAEGMQATLDRDKSRLVFYKRGLPVTPVSADVDAAILEIEAAGDEVSTADDNVEIPAGRYRKPGDYYSFQNHFPVVYGVSEDGVGGGTGEERQTLANQLKGYLLFFDQILANYCAQLARVRDLFSLNPALGRTYYAQVVDTFAKHDEVYASGVTGASIADLLEDEDGRDARRERFLNHLISRFAERFHDFAAIMYSAFGATAEDLERARCAFLLRYPEVGAARGLGYNYRKAGPQDRWDSDNISGLERRLSAMLDILNPRRRNLSEIRLDARVEIHGSTADKFGFRIHEKPGTDVLMRSHAKYDTEEAARAGARAALARAELLSGYDLKTAGDGRPFFNVIDSTGNTVARRDEYFDGEEQRADAIDRLVAHVRANYSVEGMYLIENILLRPGESEPGDPFLPICVDPNCTDCADDDPYSYRIHVVLPAYAGRFQNMDFRRFVEEIIREETPAHVLPKICWINEDAMGKLEGAYRDWISLRSGGPSADRAATLRRFERVLYEVRNVYPTQTLAGCAEGEQPFVLGRTALGSDETTES